MKRQSITLLVITLILLLGGFIYTLFAGLRSMANQQAAHEAIRQIVVAEKNYRQQFGKYGTLKELEASNLIKKDLAEGIYKGFRYRVVIQAGAFTITAIPVRMSLNGYWGTGHRVLCVNENGPCNPEEEKKAIISE
jgi:hypothetical protein